MALTVGELRVILEARIDRLETGLRQAENRVNRFGGRANATTAGVQRGFQSLGTFIRGTFLPILAALGVAATAGEFFDLIETSTLLRNRLRLVTDGVDELTDTFGALRQIANDTRVGLDTTVELFSRLARSTEDLGISQSRLANLTETVNQTLAISGSTSAEANAALIQFSQGLASGALRGDELRSVLEQLPALAREIARGLGVGVGQLRELGQTGQLTAAQIIEALESRAPEIARQFEQITPTIGQAFTVVQNELLVFVDALNQATGVSGLFSNAILDAADGLAEALAAAFRVTAQNLARAALGFADFVDVLENVGVSAGGLQEVFRTLLDVVNVVVQGLQTGFRSIQTGLAAIGASVQSIGNALGVVSDEEFAEAIEDFGRAQEALIASSAETEEALARLARGFVEIDSTASQEIDTRLQDSIRGTAASIAASAGSVEETIARLQGARERLSTEAGAAATTQTALTSQQENTLQRILRVEQSLNLARLRGVDPLLAQRQTLEDQIGRLREITGPQQIIEARDRAIAALRREQLRLTERQEGALAALPIVLDDVERKLAELEVLSPEAATRARDQLDAALVDGIGSEAQLEKLRGVLKEVSVELIDLQDEASLSIGEGVAAGLRSAFDEAIRGDYSDALSAFGRGLEDAANESLSRAFEQAAGQLGDLLDSVLPSSLAGLGGPLTGVLGSAIGAALQSEEISTSVGNVQSAVTSAQQVRGIVAGPTSIAVADVGRSIQDAFLESERLLGIIASNTGRIAAGSGAGAAGSPVDESAQALANESASLI